MIGIYGDSDNKEEVLASFKLINRGDSVAKADRIDLVMADHDSVYFKSTAPAVDGGWNYEAYAQTQFNITDFWLCCLQLDWWCLLSLSTIMFDFFLN